MADEQIRKLTQRVEELEQRVDNLAARGHPGSKPDEPRRSPPDELRRSTPDELSEQPGDGHEAQATGPFWALHGLREQVPSPGGVMYVGSVELDAGDYAYQWARPTGHLMDADWAERAEAISALGHALRLAIARRLIDGERTVAQLVDELELASTGVAYHHLHALQSGGWVTSPVRGSWAIPASRVVPLLAIILATEPS